MPDPGTRASIGADGQPTRSAAEMIDGRAWPSRAAAGHRTQPVLPTGGLRRTGRLAALPLRHAARTAAAATHLSRAAAGQVAARTAEQIFGTLGGGSSRSWTTRAKGGSRARSRPRSPAGSRR
jgi:hypothetical protein